MSTLTWQTMLWCLAGFLVGALAAYLLAMLIAPSGPEALAAYDERAAAQPEDAVESADEKEQL